MHEPRGDRRAFFKQGVRRLLVPLADYLERRVRPAEPRVLLRPPGALAEEEFLHTCIRSGSCIEVCPARAIAPLAGVDGPASGTPAIDADLRACVVCEGLQCMKACPSGALQRIDDPLAIDMGLAHVYGPLCVRSDGEDCTICVDQCPVAEHAILFVGDGPPEVLDPGCVGCGVCQQFCPTSPKAITVAPR